MAKITQRTARELQELLRVEHGLHLVHFASPLFSGCKHVREQVAQLSPELDGLLPTSEVQLELHQADLIRGFEIELLPTLVVFLDGVEVERLEKALPSDELETCLKDIVSFYLPPAGQIASQGSVGEEQISEDEE